jgi:hypothetical protein
VFDFTRLKGVRVPGVDIPGRSGNQTKFSFYMETDGVGCSFVVKRPKGQAGKKLTPMDVEIDPDNTVFRAVDPGMTDLVKGITFELVWREDDAMEGGGEWMLQLSNDRDSVFSVSAKEWHARAGSNIIFILLFEATA